MSKVIAQVKPHELTRFEMKDFSILIKRSMIHNATFISPEETKTEITMLTNRKLISTVFVSL